MDRKKGTMDHTLLILVVILIVFGLTVLLSTSAYNGQVKFSDPASYFKKQFFATILGVVAMYVVAEMDYHDLEKWAGAAYLLSLVLSTLVLFVGASINWLQTMAEPRALILPAIGVCETGGDFISGPDHQQKREEEKGDAGAFPDPGSDSAHRWSCGNQ